MDFFRRISLSFALAAIASLAAAGGVAASGFALKEQSAAAQGNAFAGATAGAEDATYLFFNPATLGRLEKSGTTAVLSFIAPQSELERGRASTVTGAPIAGESSVDDAADDALLPALYGVWAPDGPLRFGIGVNVPFGLETNYPDDWVGRYHALHSELRTININPVVAWRINDWATVAAGFQAQYAEAKLSNALDFGSIGNLPPPMFGLPPIPGATPAAQDGGFRLEGDDWGYGWNAGVLIEPLPGTRLGVAYRSKIDHTFDGDADFRLDGAGVGAALRGATGLFRNTGAEADLTTPESASIGFHHDITPRWAVMAEAAWTRWSRFEDLVIKFDNPVQPDNVTEENWDDTWFYALGVSWKPSPAWTLRTGVAFDESPVPGSTRTPRIPDEDRTWLSFGIALHPTPTLSLDVAYTHIWVDDSDLELTAAGAGNTFRGNLSGSYDNSIDIAALQLAWQF